MKLRKYLTSSTRYVDLKFLIFPISTMIYLSEYNESSEDTKNEYLFFFLIGRLSFYCIIISFSERDNSVDLNVFFISFHR